MRIRTKLTILFLVINAIILVISFILINYSQTGFRKEQYKDRLVLKGNLILNKIQEKGSFDNEDYKNIQRGFVSLFNEQIIIYGPDGFVHFSTPENPFFQVSLNQLTKNIQNKEGLYNNGQHEGYAFNTIHDNQKFTILLSAVDIYGKSKLEYLKNVLLIAFFGGLFISTLAGWFFAGSALSPINRIITQVDQITIGKLNSRLEKTNNKDELGKLTDTFNSLLDRLELAFQSQKTFIANASHELRTPLTIISGELEVSLLKARTNEDYKKTIEDVLLNIKNLNQINSSLLLLAQSNNQLLDEKKKVFRLDDLIWIIRTDFIKLKPENKIEVVFDRIPDDEMEMYVEVNEHLMKIAISNLLDNACKFSDNHATKINLDFSGEKIKISIIDQGPGISKDEIESIFQPLYRGKNTIDKSGYGLGLPIAENIIKMHGGYIEVRSELGAGSTFIVNLDRMTV